MPKVVDHSQRRHEITWGLWAVIYERGIPGVSFGAVAAAAGVSVGRIQHYFPSKRQLVLEGARAIVAVSAQVWSATGPDDARGKLSALVRQPIPRSEDLRLGAAVWCAYLSAATADPEIGAVVRDALRDGFDTATRLADDLPDLDAGNPARATAVRLTALSNGLAQAVLVGALDAEEALTLIDGELERLESRGAPACTG